MSKKPMNDYKNLPDELKREGLFCLWRYEKVRGRRSKIPYTLFGCRARSTERDDFCTFSSAVKVAFRYDGIGLGIFDGYSAIDIDDCVIDGRLSELAKDVIRTMDSYTELSPSGNGVRIIFKAGDFSYDKEKYYINNRKNKLEVYVSGCTNKYVTLTGNVLRDVPIAERSAELWALLDYYMRKSPPSAEGGSRSLTDEGAGKLSDDEVLEKAKSAKNGRKFRELWGGKFPNSHSEADLALCSMLAFWCGGDGAQVDRIFRQSALYRKKWERKDYREGVINLAISGREPRLPKPRREPRLPEPPLEASVGSYNFINGGSDKLFKLHPEQNQNYSQTDTETDKLLKYLNETRPDDNPSYPQTDIGAGRLFADCFKDTARYVPERKSWYCYCDGVWTQDVGNLKAMERLKELSNALMTYALTIDDELRRTSYIKFCARWQKRHDREIFLRDAQGVHPVLMEDFDLDPYIFNCKNGTLHLDTMEFTEHKPEDRLTKISDVEYDPNAECRRFDYFVGEICEGDEEKALFLQKALGYALSGDTRHECLFILYGATTRNGKGTLCESVLGVLGDYGCTSRPETVSTNLNRHSSSPSEDIARLAGKRFVNISEPSKGLNLDAAKLKAMTGNDSLNARFLNENSFDFKPQFKIYINTNYLPVVTDMTLFTSGRIITIPFERHFDEDEQDKTLKEEFSKPENKSAILNWLIEGFRLQSEEGLGQPYAVRKATESYQNDSDKILCFTEDCLIPDDEAEVKTSEVYARYQAWCADNGYRTEGMRTFKQSLLTFAKVIRRKPKAGGNKTTLLLGYKLQNELL